jgi:Fic family protein
MATTIRAQWVSSFEGMSRRDRQGCAYDAYLPDHLSGWDPALPADLAADLADAETAVRELNRSDTSHPSLDGVARFLLRAESVASSKIEGLDAGPRRLLDAEATLANGVDGADRIAVEVLANIAAMDAAVEIGARAESVALADLLAIHRMLMESSPTPQVAGIVRSTQNWVGGSSYTPCSAAFIPPPPDHIPALLDDLVSYLNDDRHPALVQAALAHVQFETIHPFADGNGRTGRALIHVVLRRRGLAPRFVPPISLILATWADDYISGLVRYRHMSAPGSPERSTAAAEWLRTFATATTRSCADATVFANRIAQLRDTWQTRLGGVRSNSAAALLLAVVPGSPIVTVESAARLIGRSEMRTGEAINRMEAVGILRQRNVGRQRYRVFESPEVVDLLTGLERSLAIPLGDTEASPPNRRVPSATREPGV